MSDLRHLVKWDDKKFLIGSASDVKVEDIEPIIYGLWNTKTKSWGEIAPGQIFHTYHIGVAMANLQSVDDDWAVMEIGKDGKPVLWGAVETDDNSQSD